MTRPARLRVAMDVRCLESGELRGFARYSAELLAALLELDAVEVVAVSDTPMQLPSPLPDLVVHAPEPSREWRREQVGLPRLLSDLAIDVLFGPANRGIPLLGPPSVLTLHDAVEWDRTLVERPSGRDLVRFGYANLASLLGATRIITVSQHAAGELETDLGLGADRVRVVSEAPGSAFRVMPDAHAILQVRRELDLAGPFIAYLGGFDHKKSVETLVAAWARLEPSTTPMLVLAGKIGDEREQLQSLVTDLGGEPSRLRFLGYLADELLPGFYAASDLFVFPAIAEGFGLPPVEAMSVGTATIVADAGSLPESTRGAALRFPARDVAALSRLIRELVDEPARRRVIGEAGRAAVSSRSWSDVASDTVKVFHEAAGVAGVHRWSQGVRSAAHAHRWVR